MEHSLAGKLLVATPGLVDPNFARTVVLVVEHDEEDGAMGLVLNRPTGVETPAPLDPWKPLLDPATVFAGGPVGPAMAVGLADTPAAPGDGWRPLVANIGLVDLGEPPETVGGVLRARAWAGYAGWTPGQLEAELTVRSWFVVDAQPSDVFTTRPTRLWRDVLRRQPDRLAWYANYPPDPAVN